MQTIAVTTEMIDRLERHVAYQLAGLEDPNDGATYKYNALTGKSELFRKPPELPPARELLRQLLEEGRSPSDPFVVAAKEATVAELLVGQPLGQQTDEGAE